MRAIAFLFSVLVVAGTTVSSFAAEAAAPAVTPDTAAGTEAQSSDVPADDNQTTEEMLAAEAALQAEEAKARAADTAGEATAPAPTGSSANDNEDFVPTVQISEDLSVSFPVDI